jgi:hypothetical protein
MAITVVHEHPPTVWKMGNWARFYAEWRNNNLLRIGNDPKLIENAPKE